MSQPWGCLPCAPTRGDSRRAGTASCACHNPGVAHLVPPRAAILGARGQQGKHVTTLGLPTLCPHARRFSARGDSKIVQQKCYYPMCPVLQQSAVSPHTAQQVSTTFRTHGNGAVPARALRGAACSLQLRLWLLTALKHAAPRNWQHYACRTLSSCRGKLPMPCGGHNAHAICRSEL